MSVTLVIPDLETDRLVLRAPLIGDFEAYAAFRASARSQHIGGPNNRSEAFQQFCALTGHWQMRGYGRWIVTLRGQDAAIGVVGLFHPLDWPEPEIAWSVFDGHEGQGIALEAAMASRDYAYRTLGWDRVVSMIAAGNTRSIALAARLGAVHDYDHTHPIFGVMPVYRHLSPQELS